MSVRPIIEVIFQLTKLYESLCQLGEQKKEAMVNDQIDEMNQIISKEGRLIKQVVLLDGQRVEAIHHYLLSKGIRRKVTVTIGDLAPLVFQAEERQELLHARDRLSETMSRMKRINDLNRQLAEQSLAYINFTLDVVASPQEEPTYSNPLKQQRGGANQSGLFEWKA